VHDSETRFLQHGMHCQQQPLGEHVKSLMQRVGYTHGATGSKEENIVPSCDALLQHGFFFPSFSTVMD